MAEPVRLEALSDRSAYGADDIKVLKGLDAGTLAYSIESFEDFDVFSGVVFCCHPVAFWIVL